MHEQIRVQYLFMAIVFIVVAVLKLPNIWHTIFPINALALQATQNCTNQSMAPDTGLLIEANLNLQTAWLLGATANCSGDIETAHNYWKLLLSGPNRFLPLIRAAEPNAVELAAMAAANQSNNALAFFWLGDGLLAQEDNQGAVDAYERALLALDKNDADTWMKIGRLYEAEGNWQKAVHAYDLACQYWDKGKNGCPNAGRLYMAHDEYELAAQRYQASIKQLPYWNPAKKGLVEALLAMGQYAEAVPYLQTLAESGDSEAMQMLEQINSNSN